MTLKALRGSVMGLVLACAAWSVGCATAPRPMVDPVFAAGAYSPGRVALLPPDVFVVLDQVGDNDPVKSAALGQSVSIETVRVIEQTLRSRGYDVDLSARWDGIVAPDGSVLVNRDELGWLANGVLQFANSPDGGGNGTMTVPRFVAPELAAKIGWATQSDALLYVNIKGVTTTNGKRTASILAAVFIVAIIAAIILIAVAESKGGGGSSHGPAAGSGGSAWRGQPVARAPATGGFHGAPLTGGRAASMPGGAGGASTGALSGGGRAASVPGGGGWAGGRAGGMPAGNAGGAASGGLGAGGRATAIPGGNAAPGGGSLAGAPAAGGGWRGAPASAPSVAPATGGGSGGWRGGGAPAAGAGPGGGGWRGGGAPPARPYGAPVYGGGPHVGIGVGVFIPLDGPTYTHDGNVTHEDEIFAGDELYVAMTMVSTYDGRVLWHAREHLDLDAEDNQDVERMVHAFLGSLPPRVGAPVAAPAAR